ncbi:DEAD/DEAH box helicase, partial [candidate division KSB1 bacterium]|nr:DEAD/DEAH box helicase [candidate division KSB1 bacterium]
MADEMQKRVVDQPVEKLAGIGPKKAAQLVSAGVVTIGDLFYYFPRRYLDRSCIAPIGKLQDGQEATVFARVHTMGVKKGRRNRFVLVLSDDSGFLSCIWFSRLAFWGKIFRIGEWLAVSGKVSLFGGPQMIHPEFDRLSDSGDGELLNTGKIIPQYPSSEALGRVGLDSRGFRRLLHRTLQQYRSSIPETLPQEIRTRHHLLPLADALYSLHFPSDFAALDMARKRLAFDEFFFMELTIAYRKKRWGQAVGGIAFLRVGDKVRALLDSLPYELTEAQKRVLREIRADMKSDRPMNRLLQGDVGAGKTVVALVTLLIAVENGYQAVMMAPTEILAEQHFLFLHQTLSTLDVRVVLLIGGQPKAVRRRMLEEIESGKAQIIVGTHALIQEQV